MNQKNCAGAHTLTPEFTRGDSRKEPLGNHKPMKNTKKLAEALNALIEHKLFPPIGPLDIPLLGFVDIVEILYPHMKGKVKENEPFPCPLWIHKKNDTRPIVWENSDFPGWRCFGGCTGERTKDTIEFVQYALALDTYVHACAVYRKLNNLKHQGKSHQHYLDCIDDLFPDWYEEVNEGLLV